MFFLVVSNDYPQPDDCTTNKTTKITLKPNNLITLQAKRPQNPTNKPRLVNIVAVVLADSHEVHHSVGYALCLGVHRFVRRNGTKENIGRGATSRGAPPLCIHAYDKFGLELVV